MFQRKKKVLFVGLKPSRFIQKDRTIVEKYFSTQMIYFSPKKKFVFLFRLFFKVLRSHLTISWFADIQAYYAVYFSKILRKKSIVIVGGYEVANIPQIQYGLARSLKTIRKVKFALSHADKVLPVSESLKKDALNNIQIHTDNIEVVPNGYNFELFKPGDKKENLVLTVFHCSSWTKVYLKGLDVFSKAAAQLPQVNFLVVGVYDNMLKELQKQASENVSFIERLSTEDLIPIYQRAKVYCQLSMREGHPNALSEAMLCGCVPVGTESPGIQAVIGDTGFLVPYGDVEQTVKAIQKALKSYKGPEARKRIQTLFPFQRREKELINIIRELTGKKNYRK